MAFSFGTATTRPSLFGATATPAPVTGGLFGTASSTGGLFGAANPPSTGFAFGASTAQPAASGFGGFGAATTSAAPATFAGFGAAASQANTAFGNTPKFGVNTTGALSFGTALTAKSTASAFGQGLGFGGGLNTLGGTGFGAGSAFGGLGAKPAATTGFAGFGPQAVTPQQAAANALTNIGTAVSLPTLFGDERDAVVAKWNQLQAFWGTGKGYFTQQGDSVDFKPDNPFSLFKAVGYSCIPTSKDEDGLIGLVINMNYDLVCANQQQIVDALHKLFGSRPNLTICVDSVRPVLDNKVELTFFVQDRTATGNTTRICASDVFGYLNQPVNQQTLATQLNVVDIMPRTGMKPDQLKLYLDLPPSGIDSRIWEQAKLDNPDPTRLIPVPMVGFDKLHERLKHQDQQTQLHQTRLEVITSDISTLRHNLADMIAKLDQYKRTQLLLSHRVLKVLVQQEVHRKHSYAIQANEEQLRTQLEAITCELNAPTQFKGRLNELMSELRMQNQSGAMRSESGYRMEPNVQQEIQQHLKQQQAGLKHLMDIIKDDLEDLKLIEQGMSDSARPPQRR